MVFVPKQLESFALPPWASRRDLLELLDRPTIPVSTALAFVLIVGWAERF